MTWGDCLLPAGDEVFVYAMAAYGRGNAEANPRWSVRSALPGCPRDRFVSRDAGPGGGSLRTRSCGSRLVPAGQRPGGGEFRVRVCDERGDSDRWLRRFRLCAAPRRFVEASVRWNGWFAALGRRPIRLEFAAHVHAFYGFELVQ